MKGTKLIRIGPELLKKLDRIRELEDKRRSGDKTGYSIAGEILSNRIDLAGGLRESN